MSGNVFSQTLHLSPENNTSLNRLCGMQNQHLELFEHYFNIQVKQHGFHFQLDGKPKGVKVASQAIQQIYKQAHKKPFNRDEIHLQLISNSQFMNLDFSQKNPQNPIKIGNKVVVAHSPNQSQLLKLLRQKNIPINFAIGPTGSGKTYLSIAAAIESLQKNNTTRIVLTRPAVEAGEQLGFLPGDMVEKIAPYLQPLYDALYDLLGKSQVDLMVEKNIIEIAPIAFMRGRTLNNSFIILDEAQNATAEQIKMILTRIGYDTKLAIAGDITQTDLPREKQSGLKQTIDILQHIKHISFSYLNTSDILRHPIVQEIVDAYTEYHKNT